MRLLFLTHRVPCPPDRGDRIRSYHLLRFLAERCEVHLACLADEPVSKETCRTLDSLCARVAIIPLGRRSRWLRAAGSLALGRSASEGLFASPQLRRTVARWSKETRFDQALVFCSSMFPYVCVPGLADVPVTVDLVDVDSQKWFDYAAAAAGPKRWLFALEGRRIRWLEGTIVDRAEEVLLVSKAEADVLLKSYPQANVHPLTNGVDLDYFHPEPDSQARAFGAGLPTPPNCVFVGALDYRANVEGIRWFCDCVWPAVRRLNPAATLSLVGRNPGPAVTRLASIPGVDLVGQVPDVRPSLWRASLVVAPLTIARGIQNKVLEAAAAGKAIIASPQAIEGLDLVPGQHLCQANAPSEWIETITRLLLDAPARNSLGLAARQFVEQHHSWSARLEPIGALLQLPASRLQVTGNRDQKDSQERPQRVIVPEICPL